MGSGLSTTEYASQIQADIVVISKMKAETNVQAQREYVLYPINFQYGQKGSELPTQSNSAFQSVQDSLKRSNSRLQSVLMGMSSGNYSSGSALPCEEDNSFRLEIEYQQNSGRENNLSRLISSIRESIGRYSLQSIKGDLKDVDLPE